jgi:hypothetical protein
VKVWVTWCGGIGKSGKEKGESVEGQGDRETRDKEEVKTYKSQSTSHKGLKA